MDINGSVALVVGGGGGFGGATARRLSEAGATVVVLDLDEDKGAKSAAEIGNGAIYVRTDVTSEESILEAIDRAEDLGPVRIAVVAHGGGGGDGRVVHRDGAPHSYDKFKRVVDVFLCATFNVTRLAAAAIARTEPLDSGERGVIINTASIAAFDGSIGQSAYAAAKAGIVGMTLPAARDLGPLGIRVMTIAPGVFLTGAYGDVAPEDLHAQWGPTVPFPSRMGDPDEYAILAQQICENPYLNGEVIRLDGAMRFTRKGN
ncbi:SDR family NAD(P)-dependent oxidoreductase [Rhodococcus sp. NPDC058521]|uniref:SDR family NAD(P)-dependent oxidoreductase n=1 Tax=Rhodococcus sp. NPDC058521 TaxID=3346536 RepID=UPI00365C331D